TALTQNPDGQSVSAEQNVARAGEAARVAAARAPIPSARESLEAIPRGYRLESWFFHCRLRHPTLAGMKPLARRPLLAAAVLAFPLGCRPPTEAVLDITTDADP